MERADVRGVLPADRIVGRGNGGRGDRRVAWAPVRPAPPNAHERPALRIGHAAHRPGNAPHAGALLPHRRSLYPVRHRDRLLPALGGGLPQPGLFRAGRDGRVRADLTGGFGLRLEQWSVGMGVEAKLGDLGLVTLTLEKAINWTRTRSMWPMVFGLACCAIEMMSAQASHYDLSRFGMELMRASPRQSDLMIVAGRVTRTSAPGLRRLDGQRPA